MMERMMPTPLHRLLEHYLGIAAEGMCELPLYNDRLAVEAVGFAPWQGGALGVLITPWTMNLILLPGEDGQSLPAGGAQSVGLPGGEYLFQVGVGAGPPHLSLSLFTTVMDFPDQDTARAIALETLARLRSPAPGETGEGPPPGIDRALDQPLTRRALLRHFFPVSTDA